MAVSERRGGVIMRTCRALVGPVGIVVVHAAMCTLCGESTTEILPYPQMEGMRDPRFHDWGLHRR